MIGSGVCSILKPEKYGVRCREQRHKPNRRGTECIQRDIRSVRCVCVWCGDSKWKNGQQNGFRSPHRQTRFGCHTILGYRASVNWFPTTFISATLTAAIRRHNSVARISASAHMNDHLTADLFKWNWFVFCYDRHFIVELFIRIYFDFIWI